MSALRIGAIASLTVILSACASTARFSGSTPGSAPGGGRAAGNVPDAVPRAEPRSAHGNPPYYDVNGRRYLVLASADGYLERGVASWYGPDFHGHNTSSGERYDMYAMTAAHRTLPIPCYARITNLANGRSVVVRINDRGPFIANRIVDLSYAAAARLDMVRTGTAFVELRTIGPDLPLAAAAPAPSATAPASPAMSASGATPVSVPALPRGSAPETAPVALYIQIGAFADEGNARHLIARLEAAGLPHVFSLPGGGSPRLLHRVRIGPITTVEEFDLLAARLATLGYPEARLAND